MKSPVASGFSRVDLIIVIGTITGVLVILLWMLLPAVGRDKEGPGRIKCISNLKEIGRAYAIFAADNNGQYPNNVANSIAFGEQHRAWIHYQAMAKELSNPRPLACATDVLENHRKVAEDFSIGKAVGPKSVSVLKNEAVSYFVGVNAAGGMPEAILAGDRNISFSSTNAAFSSQQQGAIVFSKNTQWTAPPGNKVHRNQGNLLLGDGSVNRASVSILQSQTKLVSEKYGSNVTQFVFPQ